MKYRRVLLKISGEAIGGAHHRGFDANVIRQLTHQLAEISSRDIKLAIVIGAGNIFRGEDLVDRESPGSLSQVTADQIGILGTVMNAMVMSETLEKAGLRTRLFSTHEVVSIAEQYSVRHAKEALERNEIVFLAGGTGNPLFTTDTAACLRGIELEVDVVLKGTKVDGVYDRDPLTTKSAQKSERLTYDQVIREELQVMDLSAILLCREHKMPLIVYKLMSENALDRICRGEPEGTLVTNS